MLLGNDNQITTRVATPTLTKCLTALAGGGWYDAFRTGASSRLMFWRVLVTVRSDLHDRLEVTERLQEGGVVREVVVTEVVVMQVVVREDVVKKRIVRERVVREVAGTIYAVQCFDLRGAVGLAVAVGRFPEGVCCGPGALGAVVGALGLRGTVQQRLHYHTYWT